MNHTKEEFFETESTNYYTVFADILFSLLLLFIFFLVYQFFANRETSQHLIVKSKQSQFLEVFQKEFDGEIKKGLVHWDIDGNIQRLSFGEKLLFNLGDVDLNLEGQKILDRCVKVFEEFANEKKIYKRIQVEGHTCDAPINPNGRLWYMGVKDNWSLSAVRSLNVVRYLIGNSHLPPILFSGTGYSYFQGQPGKLYKNRKIEIVIIYSTDI
ncbi:MAG: flagellar motor protein MotB [Candidatus Omnitrophota bacterium]